jgi:hypothetical protein
MKFEVRDAGNGKAHLVRRPTEGDGFDYWEIEPKNLMAAMEEIGEIERRNQLNQKISEDMEKHLNAENKANIPSQSEV